MAGKLWVNGPCILSHDFKDVGLTVKSMERKRLTSPDRNVLIQNNDRDHVEFLESSLEKRIDAVVTMDKGNSKVNIFV